MAAKKSISVTLNHKKDTKGTRVWATDDADAAVKQLYISLPAAKDLPDKIVVTVTGS